MIISSVGKAATFNEFIDSLLDNTNPFPQKISVIVIDNASITDAPEREEKRMAEQSQKQGTRGRS
ncbi:hypothetical protein BDR04DRAFT_1101021 [Suillus decipiens]|nr:hypothetical protein BDR04DRAFT_1101021 [Suillus decipiens]